MAGKKPSETVRPVHQTMALPDLGFPEAGSISEFNFPQCQCGLPIDPKSPTPCPIHYTLEILPPADTATVRSLTNSSGGSSPDSPRALVPNLEQVASSSYRFTPPMLLENFPRPANINRNGSLATVLEERYQRRKAQNRTAQRAYRDREKSRLSIALQRVRDMEVELQSSIDMQNQWQTLYETLFREYNKLWNEITLMTPSPTASSPPSSLSETLVWPTGTEVRPVNSTDTRDNPPT